MRSRLLLAGLSVAGLLVSAILAISHGRDRDHPDVRTGAREAPAREAPPLLGAGARADAPAVGPSSVLTGYVFNVNGEPVPDATVYARTESGAVEIRRTTSARDGSWSLDSKGDASHVGARCRGYLPTQLPLPPETGEGSMTIVLRPVPERRLTVTTAPALNATVAWVEVTHPPDTPTSYFPIPPAQLNERTTFRAPIGRPVAFWFPSASTIRIRVNVDGGATQTLLVPGDQLDAFVHVPVSARLVVEVRDQTSGAPVEASVWLRRIPGGELQALGRATRGQLEVRSGLTAGSYRVTVSHPHFAHWRSDALTVTAGSNPLRLVAGLVRRADLCFVKVEVDDAAMGSHEGRESRWLLLVRKVGSSEDPLDEEVLVEKDGCIEIGLPCSALVKLLGLALDRSSGFVSDEIHTGGRREIIKPTLEITTTFDATADWTRRDVRELIALVEGFGEVPLVARVRDGEQPLAASRLARLADKLGPFIAGKTVLSVALKGKAPRSIPVVRPRGDSR